MHSPRYYGMLVARGNGSRAHKHSPLAAAVPACRRRLLYLPLKRPGRPEQQQRCCRRQGSPAPHWDRPGAAGSCAGRVLGAGCWRLHKRVITVAHRSVGVPGIARIVWGRACLNGACRAARRAHVGQLVALQTPIVPQQQSYARQVLSASAMALAAG